MCVILCIISIIYLFILSLVHLSPPLFSRLQVKHCSAMVQASVELSSALRVTPLGLSAQRRRPLTAPRALGHSWHFA